MDVDEELGDEAGRGSRRAAGPSGKVLRQLAGKPGSGGNRCGRISGTRRGDSHRDSGSKPPHPA
eukprot:16244592-Heterocapsa_arctica.AAC.1